MSNEYDRRTKNIYELMWYTSTVYLLRIHGRKYNDKSGFF